MRAGISQILYNSYISGKHRRIRFLIIYFKMGRAFDEALPILLAYCLLSGNRLLTNLLFSTI